MSADADKARQDPAEGSREAVDKQLDKTDSPSGDAAAQTESKHSGGKNDGMVSADPRSISGKESGDATFPIRKKN